ncbi:MAG: alpha-hydroxy-acid oxidizing protein, partial [Jatrophihabitantaceae bacterium]
MAQGIEHVIARQKEHAKQRVDAALFEYFAGGSDEEIALAEAGAAWASYRFLPHVLRDVSDVDVSCLLFGQRFASPVAAAPIAYQGLLHAEGEVATARGARDANTLFILSARSSRIVEEVAATAGPWWMQVYVTADRTLTEGIVSRAAACGAAALVLTGDTPYLGRRVHG